MSEKSAAVTDNKKGLKKRQCCILGRGDFIRCRATKGTIFLLNAGQKPENKERTCFLITTGSPVSSNTF